MRNVNIVKEEVNEDNKIEKQVKNTIRVIS